MMTRPYFASVALGATLLLAGCGMNTGGNGGGTSPIGGTRASVSGKVHGGQQPVSGATIQLYAVGNAGLKSASTKLIAQTVLTDGGGAFTITGLWNCTDTATYGTDPLLYITATGGNPGLAAGTNNAALAMMVALGPCSTLNANTFISINELTSAASIYALAPFMTDSAHIGAAAAGMPALKNAFNTVNTLVNTGAGTAPGLVVPGESVPVSTLNTIADIIAACVNTTGTGVCDTLFSATTPSGGSAPTDTIASTLQMARAPARNVASLYPLIVPGAPFQPVTPSMPSDFSLAVKFTGGGLSGPAGVALDASGNAWVANASGSSITGLSNQGALLTGATGFTANGSIFGAQGIAVDTAGNVWVADTLTSKLFKLTVAGGAVLSSAAFTDALAGPTGIAIDKQNHVWVANNADGTVAEFDSSGVVMGSGAFNPGSVLQAPLGIAMDASGNAWVTDNQASVVAKFDTNRNLLSGSGYSDGALVAPAGLAVDAGGKVWVAGTGDAGVSVFSNAGVGGTPVMGAGLEAPVAVALDGVGNAWVTNSAGTLTQVVAGATVPGMAVGSLNSPLGVAVDASGNVWVANSGDDSVSKFVGLAAPAVVPLVAGP